MLTDQTPAPLPEGLSADAFSSLFQAVNGLRNSRAIIALLGCTFAGVLVAALLLSMAGTLGMFATVLAMLVWVVAIGTGVNGAGLLQMDAARGISQRSIVDALVHGLLCIPKLIVLGLAFFAVEIVVFLVIALLLVVCKIPFLGPLLFVVVFPLSVVAAGITIVGVFICVVLSLPAIWQGATITRALAQTITIVKSRLVEAVLLLVFVALLCFVVGFIVFAVLGTGLVPTLGLSASIVGFSGVGDMGSLVGMAQGFGGGGHMVAGAIGGALLWAVAASLVGQVYLRGLSLVYLRVTEGLDLEGTEAMLRAKFDEARRRTGELGDKARAATGRDAAAPSAAAPSAAPPSEAASPNLPTVAPAATAAAAAIYSAPVPPAYNPPPAFSAAPSKADPMPDIELPFDDAPASAAAPSPPSYASPPAWAPPPVLPPVAAPTALPTPTTCPQCLSAITADDVFCGVCGYRLK